MEHLPVELFGLLCHRISQMMLLLERTPRSYLDASIRPDLNDDMSKVATFHLPNP
jgi:hypothetical protein